MALMCRQCDALKTALLKASVEHSNAEAALLNYREAYGKYSPHEEQTLIKLRKRAETASLVKGQAQSDLLEHIATVHRSVGATAGNI